MIHIFSKGTFLGENQKTDHMDSSPTKQNKQKKNKQTKNPRKDYLVMTRRAEDMQYLYQSDIFLALPLNSTRMENK